MRIKALEIRGFKSFADRVVIHFDHRITSVVGPNGCGKSNVVDALRWVMGEHNAKNLRGLQMQDVIFGGSQSRGPSGFAEVSLYLENDNKEMPKEYEHFSEIQLTRRLYRNGDSEFEINKRPCRLKDISDLFLGTGVGTKAYSIIEQGRISAIIAAKAEDRRQIIEEAAGITKYKARKMAALRKMETTQQNLLRICDIEREVSTQLNSLEKQARKAERFIQHKSELQELEHHLAALFFLENWQRNNFLLGQKSTTDDSLASALDTLIGVESEIAEQQRVLQDKSEKLRLQQGLLYETDSAIALNQQDVAHIGTTRDTLSMQITRTHDEIARIGGRVAEEAHAKQSCEQQLAGLGDQIANADQALQQKKLIYDDMNSKKSTAAQHVTQLAQGIIEKATRAASLQSQIQAYTKRREEALLRDTQLTQDIARLIEEEAHAQTRTQAKQEELTSALERKTALDNELLALKNKQQAQRDEKKPLEAQRQGLYEKLTGLKSRLSSLKEIEERFDAVSPAVASLFKNTSHAASFKLLSQLLEAPTELEPLMESVCHAALETIIASSDGDAISAIAHLTNSKSGRASFLVSNLLHTSKRSKAEFGHLLIDALSFSSSNRPLVEALLGDMILMDSESDALKHWQEAQALGYHLITKDGTLFAKTGVLTGGSPQKSANILSRKREIRELQTTLTELETQLTELDGRRATLATESEACDKELAQRQTDLHNMQLALVRAESVIQAHVSELKQLSSKRTGFENDKQRNTDLLATSGHDIDAWKQEWASALEAHHALELEHTEKRRLLDDAEAVLKEHHDAVSACQIQVSALTQNRTHLSSMLEQHKRNLDEMLVQQHRLNTQISETTQQLQELEIKKATAVQKIDAAKAQRQELVKTIDEQRQAHDKLSLAIRELERTAQSHRDQTDTLKARIHELMLQIREVELMLASAQERLVEKYGVMPKDIVSDYHMKPPPSDDAEKRIREIQRQIDSLGPVNPHAVTEYEELKKRHDFLQAQSSDLKLALEQLEAAIAKLNRTTKARFEEAFTAINQRFSQVFPRLFRGGQAWLALTDPNDMLNTGVEIFAQPPGKKLGSIALMSGGEKALTATSLIFSIFLIKPSPFCLLDEVDAPLDEANVRRFSQLLREMARVSQFIVITHNKQTMEIADKIYGVTMEEPGISKAVSIQVAEPKDANDGEAMPA